MDGLNKAIETAGNGKTLAELLGVHPMVITQWKRRGVPAERVLDIVRAVRGQVSPYEIRPDVYPDAQWMPDLDGIHAA